MAGGMYMYFISLRKQLLFGQLLSNVFLQQDDMLLKML